MDRKEQGCRALFWVLVGIGCLLAAVPAASIGVVADAGTPGAGTGAGATLQENESVGLDDADAIYIDVFVHENGSAMFVVDYRFDNDSDGEWERLREDVESNPDAYAERQESRWNDVRREGENATEREMEISDVAVATDTSSAPTDMGHVRVTFEWDAFAYPQLNRIEVGDALVGLSLPQNTWLQVFAPEGYEIDEVSPEPDGGNGETASANATTEELESVRWGDTGDPFSSTPPAIVMIAESEGPEQPAESDDDSGPPMPWLIVLAALALLATVGAAGWLLRRDRSRHRATSATNGGAPTNGAAGVPETDQPPPELLSNEERVLQLLEERGGRIKQQEVVSELDWTEAKTSQVVSGLREDDEIEVFRIGRENVLALPEDDEE